MREKLYAARPDAQGPARFSISPGTIPTRVRFEEPDAEAVLRGDQRHTDADGNARRRLHSLKDDGSTACGCWIYCGCYDDGVNQTARRKPRGSRTGSRRSGAGPGRTTGACSTTAPRPIRTASRGRSASAMSGGTKPSRNGPGTTNPTSQRRQAADYRADAQTPRERRRSAGMDPFIMQADGKGWLYVPSGLQDGPLPDALRAAGIADQESAVRAAVQPGAHASGSRTAATTRSTSDLRRPALPVRAHDLSPDRAPHGRRHEPRWLALALRAAARAVLRGIPELAAERGLKNGGWATIVAARAPRSKRACW